MITLVLENEYPYAELFGQESNYLKPRVFRCLCFLGLQPYTSHKLYVHYLSCVFIGYSLSHSAYLFLDKYTGHICIKTCSVRRGKLPLCFDETNNDLRTNHRTDWNPWLFYKHNTNRDTCYSSAATPSRYDPHKPELQQKDNISLTQPSSTVATQTAAPATLQNQSTYQ